MMLVPRCYPYREDDTFVQDSEVRGPKEWLAVEKRTILLEGFIGSADRGGGPYSIATSTLPYTLLMLAHLDNESPVRLVINSEGGDVLWGLYVYDIMQQLPCPIITIGMQVASMASVLFVAGTERYLLPHAHMMLHQGFTQVSGPLANAEKGLAEMRRWANHVIEIYLKHGVRLSREQLDGMIKQESWLNAQEAIDIGLADRLVEWGDW